MEYQQQNINYVIHVNRIGWKPVEELTVKHCFHLSASPYSDDQTWGIHSVGLQKLYLSEEKPHQKLIILN